MVSKMVIYQNIECILKDSGRFSNSSKWKTELKSGKLPHKTVDLMCNADICMVISAEFYVISNTISDLHMVVNKSYII